MESSEGRVDAAVRAPDWPPLFEGERPFVSAYLTTVAPAVRPLVR